MKRVCTRKRGYVLLEIHKKEYTNEVRSGRNTRKICRTKREAIEIQTLLKMSRCSRKCTVKVGFGLIESKKGNHETC